MTRASATKLRWTVTACLVAAVATAGALVAMAHHPHHGVVVPATGVSAELH